MEIEERNQCTAKIKNFVKRDKRGRLKTRYEIARYVRLLTGCTEVQAINAHGHFLRLTYKQEYTITEEQFRPFRVLLCFPYEGIGIYCSRAEANAIPYIARILQKNFDEPFITFKCVYGKRQVMDGPIVIILAGDTNSIYMKDDETLRDSLAQV